MSERHCCLKHCVCQGKPFSLLSHRGLSENRFPAAGEKNPIGRTLTNITPYRRMLLPETVYASAASKACFRSAMMSSASSRPTEKRMRRSENPAASISSLVHIEWVMEAGC